MVTSPATRLPSTPHRRLRITVRGVVQGVGFRPFVYRAARQESLSGWVLNEADAVDAELLAERAASMLRRGDAFGQWLSVGGEEAGDGGA